MRRLIVVLLLAGLLAGSAGQAFAQSEDARYFPETGHWVSGDFYTFYQQAKDSELVFGYPITEAYRDALSGRVIQYFQRARMELYPENLAGQRVKLTPLGSSLYAPGNPVLNLNNGLACRASKTGFSVCYAFLGFYDSNGGVEQFGEPISGFELYNGRIVQYFENARFEWYPELPEGQKVSLANLGRIYFDSVPESPQLLSPVVGDAILGSQVLQMSTRVFTGKATLRNDEVQDVYVIVQDQKLQPVYNASVVLTVKWSDGSISKIALSTDRTGVATTRFKVTDQAHGSLVVVNAEVLFEGLKSNSLVSFRIWE